jgi:hypothetical protein
MYIPNGINTAGIKTNYLTAVNGKISNITCNYANLLQLYTNSLTLNGNMQITGNVIMTGNINVTGDIEITENLTVLENTYLNVLDVSGTATFNDNVEIKQNLTVLENTYLNVLDVSGTATFYGDVKFLLDVSSNFMIPFCPTIPDSKPSFELLYYYLTGDDTDSGAEMELQNNFTGTTNYAVFPSIYWGYNGEEDVYNAGETSAAVRPIVISTITSTSFRWSLNKSDNRNVNIYLLFLVVYNITNSDYPKAYPN